MKKAYIALGTNKGNREKNISLALKLLSENLKEIKILKVSSMLNNPPQEGIKSGDFLNGIVKIETTLMPYDLLHVCKDIEKKLGRAISYRRKKPRVIDLDILFYENEIINTRELIIPHPRAHLRYFVLIPLLEIEPDLIHPVLKKPIKELAMKVSHTTCVPA